VIFTLRSFALVAGVNSTRDVNKSPLYCTNNVLSTLDKTPLDRIKYLEEEDLMPTRACSSNPLKVFGRKTDVVTIYELVYSFTSIHFYAAETCLLIPS
jgi:hypothetical protein